MRHCLSCALCAFLSLALAIMALRYVTDFWLLSLVYSFQTHAGIACIAAAVVCIFMKRNVLTVGLLAISVFLTGHSIVMKQQFVRQAVAAPAGSQKVRVLSFNMLNENFANSERIADYLLDSNADVAFFMEANPIASQLEKLATKYPYQSGCGPKMPGCEYSILSKFPIKSEFTDSLSDIRRNHFGVIETEIAGKTVRFALAHLTKPYFDNYHELELRRLSLYLDAFGGTIILGGDFNSSSIAPDMQRFLKDSSLSKTGPEPATWPIAAGRYGIAIDHIFVTDDVTPLSLQRIPDSLGSNHFGIIADVAIGDGPRSRP